MAKVISTVEMKNSLIAGKDKNLDDKKDENLKDFPLTIVDQSKTCSTRNIVPNKREIRKKDIQKFVNNMKEKVDISKNVKTESKKKKVEKELKDKE